LLVKEFKICICLQFVVPSGGNAEGCNGATAGGAIGQIAGGQIGGTCIELEHSAFICPLTH
jgi:hypothetical protein